MKISRLKIKTQSTIETCLSMCLIAFLEQKGIPVPENEEINILVEGIKFTKFDYSTGHLVYVASKYPVRIEQHIDYLTFYQLLSKFKYPKNMKLFNTKIDHKSIAKFLQFSPIILYVDQYYLEGGLHISHLVILEGITDEIAIILDSWDGRRKKIPTKILIRSIQSLRNKLKISPKIIRVL